MPSLPHPIFTSFTHPFTSLPLARARTVLEWFTGRLGALDVTAGFQTSHPQFTLLKAGKQLVVCGEAACDVGQPNRGGLSGHDWGCTAASPFESGHRAVERQVSSLGDILVMR